MCKKTCQDLIDSLSELENKEEKYEGAFFEEEISR